MTETQVIYIAGPYSASSAEGVAEHVRVAALVGREILRRGHVPLCPHTMTHDWDIGTGLDYQTFIAADLVLLDRCDAICMVGDWLHSRGACGELDRARALGLTIYFGLAEVPTRLRESSTFSEEAE